MSVSLASDSVKPLYPEKSWYKSHRGTFTHIVVLTHIIVQTMSKMRKENQY